MKKVNENIKKIIDFSKKNNPRGYFLDKIFSWNSKSVKPDQIFISIKTKKSKKYDYINEAIDRGAKAIISDSQIRKSSLSKNLPILHSDYLKDNSNKVLNFIYKNPLKNIKVFGVTGTDGKTSQLHLLAQGLHLSGKKVGVISSEGNGIYPKLNKAAYTTPPADILFNYFKQFNIAKVNIILVECSSQGIDQGRLSDIEFNLSILTNINKDHIDYHRSLKNYIGTKIKLLNMTKNHIFLNESCPTTTNNLKLINTKAKKHFFGLDLDFNYTNIKLGGTISDYYNIGVVFKILKLQKISIKKILKVISKLKPVVGRNQFIKTKNKGTYIIDYAHTPSSLLTLLKTINFYSILSGGKLITVFGCGGNRDIWKRKIMGNISAEFSSHIILTDDNPRTEDPMKIINDIKKGINKRINLSIIPSRKSAILKAVSFATRNDYIVIAGKGNENDILYKNHVVKHNDLKVLKARLK